MSWSVYSRCVLPVCSSRFLWLTAGDSVFCGGGCHLSLVPLLDWRQPWTATGRAQALQGACSPSPAAVGKHWSPPLSLKEVDLEMSRDIPLASNLTGSERIWKPNCWDSQVTKSYAESQCSLKKNTWVLTSFVTPECSTVSSPPLRMFSAAHSTTWTMNGHQPTFHLW